MRSLMTFKKCFLLIISCPLCVISTVNNAYAQTITMEQCFQEVGVANLMYPLQIDAYTEITGSSCYLNASMEVSVSHIYNLLVDTSNLPENVPEQLRVQTITNICSNPLLKTGLASVGEYTYFYNDKASGALYTSFTMTSKDC